MAAGKIKDFEKMYEEANDQHVAAVTLYGDASGKKAYADSKKQLTMDSKMKEYVYKMFKEGRVLVSMDSKLYKPVACDTSAGTVSVVTITGSGTLVATPVDLTLM